MKLKGHYRYITEEGQKEFSAEERKQFSEYPFRDAVFFKCGDSEQVHMHTKLSLREIDSLAEKYPDLRNGFRGHRLYEYKDGKLTCKGLWLFTAKQNYKSWVNCLSKIEHFKNKYTSLPDDIVTNRKTKLFGFERLRYCNNRMNYTMPFALYKPKNINNKLPLVIFLHGYTNGGEENILPFTECLHFANKIKRNIKKNPCIILVPSIPKYCGYFMEKKNDIKNQTGFEGIFSHLLAKLKEKYPIDENRIYIVGSSNGAGGIWSQLRLHPDRYAAAIPMMGFCDVADDEYFESIKDIAIWAVHAENDKSVDIRKSHNGYHGSDTLVEGLKKAGAPKLRYSRCKRFGHRVSFYFLHTQDWYTWLFEQTK